MIFTDRSVGNRKPWRHTIKKGKMTREMILHQAAALFNTRGYFGASMSDLMAATGLEKGGIYNHFTSKDELALEAFDYAVKVNGQIVLNEVNKHTNSIDQLCAFASAFAVLGDESPIPGGCPLLNTAIECDDAHPEMKTRVQVAIKSVLRKLKAIIRHGVESGEIGADVDPDAEAKLIFASIEGAIMLSRISEDKQTMQIVIKNLVHRIRLLAPQAVPACVSQTLNE